VKKVPPPVAIPQPPAPPPGLAADVVASGLPVHPEDRVRLFSADQWERFVQEWVDSLRDEYELVERCGGAGDMGRDVIATVKGGNGAWDNYQCKHYQKALAPGDVWIELGKLAYYTLKSEYSYPRAYFFVAPQGVGPTLSNLLKKPHALRDGLLANWDKACRTEITKTEVVECDTRDEGTHREPRLLHLPDQAAPPHHRGACQDALVRGAVRRRASAAP
jgi:hypothetical protein